MLRMNMGGIDRLIRAGVIGPALFVLAISQGPWTPLGVIALVLGFVMFLTAAFASCPLYTPVRLSTCRRAPSGPRATGTTRTSH